MLLAAACRFFMLRESEYGQTRGAFNKVSLPDKGNMKLPGLEWHPISPAGSPAAPFAWVEASLRWTARMPKAVSQPKSSTTHWEEGAPSHPARAPSCRMQRAQRILPCVGEIWRIRLDEMAGHSQQQASAGLLYSDETCPSDWPEAEASSADRGHQANLLELLAPASGLDGESLEHEEQASAIQQESDGCCDRHGSKCHVRQNVAGLLHGFIRWQAAQRPQAPLQVRHDAWAWLHSCQSPIIEPSWLSVARRRFIIMTHRFARGTFSEYRLECMNA